MMRISSLLAATLSLLGLTLAATAQTPTVRYAFAGNANDLSGNARHGTLLGTASIGAATLVIAENTTGRVRVPESAINGLNDFTVVATVQITPVHVAVTPVNLNPIISGARVGEDNALMIAYRHQTGSWQVDIGSASVPNPSQSYLVPLANRPITGVWHHVAYVRQTVTGVTTGRFYQDGVQVGATLILTGAPSISPITVDPNGLLIGQEQDVVDGGFSAAQSLKGSMGEFAIYNGALSAARIAEMAQANWTGDVSTDWALATNWSLLAIPGATTDARVMADPTTQPVISASATARALTLEAGSALQQTAAGTLDLKGNFTNASVSTDLQGTTTFTGIIAQQIGGVNTGFANLTIGAAGTTDVSTGLSVARVLTLNGNLTVGGTALVLRSNASGTAMVVNSGGIVSGSVAVQRFVSPSVNPGAGYRHLASPVQSTTVSDLNTSVYTAVTNPAYNTAPKPLTAKPYPNIFSFTESRITGANFVHGYVSPASPAATLVPGLGYSVQMPPSTGSSSTPDFVGALNDGSINSEPLTNTNGTIDAGWHLLGNPYPAPLDWNLVRAIPGAIPAGMADAVSVYQSTGMSTGTYLTYVNGVGTLLDGLIPMGQGFFVRNTVMGSSPVFQFTNAMRTTTYANPTVYRAAPDQRPLLQMALTSTASGTTDEAIVYFEAGATAGFDTHYDAPKVSRSLETAPTLSVMAGPAELAISGLAPEALTAGTEVPLRVLVNVPGSHTLRVAAQRGLPTGQALWLTDAETGSVVDLNQLPGGYTFQQMPAYGGTRFWMQFGGRQPVATPRPTGLILDAYPNPVIDGTLTVALRGLTMDAGAVEATLVDQLGRVVRQAPLPTTAGIATGNFVVNDLPPGVYILQLKTKDSGSLMQKVVVGR